MFEKIIQKKEELQLNVQKMFTKIRSVINEREDEILADIDKKYKENFCDETIIKESDKLPNKIKKSLEKGNINENDWNDANKLSSLINDCINIEMNIKNIKYLNDSIEKCKKINDIEIKFIVEDESIEEFINSVKTLGETNIIQLKNEEPKNLEEEEQPEEKREDQSLKSESKEESEREDNNIDDNDVDLI